MKVLSEKELLKNHFIIWYQQIKYSWIIEINPLTVCAHAILNYKSSMSSGMKDALKGYGVWPSYCLKYSYCEILCSSATILHARHIDLLHES